MSTRRNQAAQVRPAQAHPAYGTRRGPGIRRGRGIRRHRRWSLYGSRCLCISRAGEGFHKRWASPPRSSAFSMLELLIAVAVIAILASIALPYYRDYQVTGREAALAQQISTLAVFQENTRLRIGSYGAGVYNPTTGDNTLTAAIGWKPAEGHAVHYVVTANGTNSWRVTATDQGGHSICRELPANAPCD